MMPLPIYYPRQSSAQSQTSQPFGQLAQQNEYLKQTRRQNFGTYTFDLGIARTAAVQEIQGDFLLVQTVTGNVSIQLNEKDTSFLDLTAINPITTVFNRIYLTNTAQPGKTLIIVVGKDAAFGASVAASTSKLVNTSGVQINPATEDTLAALTDHKLVTPSAPTFATVGVASAAVLVANASRKYAIFTNDSVNVIYLALGANPAVVGSGIKLNASGGAYEINWTNLYTGEVRAIATVAGSNLCLLESV